MVDTKQAQASWGQLSGEVLERIFAILQKSFLGSSCLWHACLVCRHFSNTFQQCPELHRTLYIKDCRTQLPSLPDLLQSIKQHGSAVQHLRATYSSERLEKVLAALHRHDCHMMTVMLSRVTNSAVCMLSAFTRLTSCTLQAKRDEDAINLQSFRALESLRKLCLCGGEFVDVAAQHLTALSLDDCVAYCSEEGSCAASLLQLHVKQATLADFHDSGIVACSSLMRLTCSHGNIPAADLDSDMLCEDEFVVPMSLSDLTGLTSLQLSGVLSQYTEMLWLTQMTNLKHVSMSATTTTKSFAVLPAGMSLLTNLRSFKVDTEAELSLEFHWRAFKLLESVSLQGRLSFDRRTTFDLCGLANCPSLQVVTIGSIKHKGVWSADAMAMFMYQLGLANVRVRWEGYWE